jgi:hypothetical protein
VRGGRVDRLLGLRVGVCRGGSIDRGRRLRTVDFVGLDRAFVGVVGRGGRSVDRGVRGGLFWGLVGVACRVVVLENLVPRDRCRACRRRFLLLDRVVVVVLDRGGDVGRSPVMEGDRGYRILRSGRERCLLGREVLGGHIVGEGISVAVQDLVDRRVVVEEVDRQGVFHRPEEEDHPDHSS